LPRYCSQRRLVAHGFSFADRHAALAATVKPSDCFVTLFLAMTAVLFVES
jgi:hypothetical protein